MKAYYIDYMDFKIQEREVVKFTPKQVEVYNPHRKVNVKKATETQYYAWYQTIEEARAGLNFKLLRDISEAKSRIEYLQKDIAKWEKIIAENV